MCAIEVQKFGFFGYNAKIDYYFLDVHLKIFLACSTHKNITQHILEIRIVKMNR